MGKYSEALRKIEEERKKEDGINESGKPSWNLKPYMIAALLLLVFVLAVAYGYGLRHGARLPEDSALEHGVIPVDRGADPTEIVEGEDLLQNVEQILKLSYGKDGITNEQTVSVNDQVQADYYTVQLGAYQEETRARQEVIKLTQEGLNVFALNAGRFYAVCAGRFTTRDQAAFQLLELKKGTFQDGRYQDAFVRLVKLKK